MKLSSSFWVPAAPERVFAHFLDPDSMRACVPGCQELEKVDDTHYRGTLVNEVAHVRFSAGFTAEITEQAGPGQVKALLRGEDRRLGSSIKIEAALAVNEDGSADSSRVEFGLDVALWGKIGRLGESIVRRRTEEVERQFAADFSRVCAAGPPGPGNAVARELLDARGADQRAKAPVAVGAAGASASRPAVALAGDGATPGRISWCRHLGGLLTGRRVLVLAAIAVAATGGVIAGLSRIAAARR
ncbi:CoxG family protein [Pseudonocardia sp. CA-142604]|uniref:CoxG family protein n=1 Tax=Pseudonocardia sp. CA-142604 TaxID=3240024 RepID=UPI003D8C8C52